MAEDKEPLGISVRSIISIFERKPTNSEQTSLKTSKSFSRSHTSLRKVYSPETQTSYDFSYQDLVSIEHHLQDLEEELRQYESYSKEEHTYFQTELVTILSEIVNVESNDENISKKKKQLILVVRNLNALLTSRLPGEKEETFATRNPQRRLINGNNKQIRKGQPVVRQPSEEKGYNPEISSSVSSLKKIFEQKSKENGGAEGLNIIVKDETQKCSDVRRVMSFSDQTCRYRYLPYRDRISGIIEENDVKYVVEGTNLKKDRVVHKTNLFRNKSMKELKIISTPAFEKQTSGKSSVSITEVDGNPSDVVDSAEEVPVGKVSEIIGKIERSISIETNYSSGNIHQTNLDDDDVERKFEEIFIEEITDDNDDDDDDDSTLKSEKIVMLCEPKQMHPSEVIEEVIPHVNVSQLVRQLETNAGSTESTVKVLHRSVSNTLPNYIVDSDNSDSIETVINCSVSEKTNGFVEASEGYVTQSDLEIRDIVSDEQHEENFSSDPNDSKDSLLY